MNGLANIREFTLLPAQKNPLFPEGVFLKINLQEKPEAPTEVTFDWKIYYKKQGEIFFLQKSGLWSNNEQELSGHCYSKLEEAMFAWREYCQQINIPYL